MLKRLLLPVTLVLLGCGCGGSDRPATSDSIVTAESKLDPGASASGADGEPCEALSHRDCTITYVDESGQRQCPTQVQICNAEGTAWLPCGQYDYDENGEPRLHSGK